MAKEFAREFYDSAAWRRCRKAFIAERIALDGGLCQDCKDEIGYIVHHKVVLTPKNIDDPDVSLNHRNLKYVCHTCHNKEHGKDMRTFFTLDGDVKGR